MSYNESCQCQACLQERYSNPGQGNAYSNLASGQGFGGSMGSIHTQHIEKTKSLEQRKVEALEEIARQSVRIANMLSVMK